MRVSLVRTLIHLFNVVMLIGMILAAMFSAHWWLGFLIFIIYILLMLVFTKIEKNANARLDELWQLADAQSLDAGDLTKRLNYTGKIPLARTKPGSRQYYLSQKQVNDWLARLK